MAYTNRGGPPFARSVTVTTTGVFALNGVANSAQVAGKPYEFAAPSSWVRWAVSGFPVKVYFSQEAFNADAADYLAIASGAVVEAPLDTERFWARGVGGTATIELLAAFKV